MSCTLSNKKGIVDCVRGGCRMEGTNIKWHYNYEATNYRNVPADLAEFIPMIQNRKKFDNALLKNFFSTRPQYLLSVNEPDMVGGPNRMTMQECLSIHQDIETKINPILLGSPAITKKYGIPYLQEFLKGTETYKPRCDFICVHWYDYRAEDFIKHIELVWTLFQKPIWVTEFSIVDWRSQLPINQDIIKNFIDIVIPFLENTPYVHRYSRFSSNKNEGVLIKCSIIDFSTNKLNACGLHYDSK